MNFAKDKKHIGTSTVNKVFYDGSMISLFNIVFVNILLTIVTLGIYTFWGKTRVRKYIVGSCSLLGNRFEYTGTGIELFWSFLKAILIVFLISGGYFLVEILIYIVFEYFEVFGAYFICIISSLLLSGFMYYMGQFCMIRYRLSKIIWKGVRIQLMGAAIPYACLRISRTIMNVVSIGFLIPYSDLEIQKYIFQNINIGSEKVHFMSNPSSLIRSNLMTLLLMVPTLGMSRCWYKAKLIKNTCQSVEIGSLRLEDTLSGGNMLGFTLGNIGISMVTLGLGFPFIMQRHVKYFSSNITIFGDINIENMRQFTPLSSNLGEGLNMVEMSF